MQDYIKGAYLVQTHCTDWAKKQTSLGWFETLAKASSPAQVQLDKNLCLCGAFSLELSTPTWGYPRAGPEHPDHATGQAHLLRITLDILLL